MSDSEFIKIRDTILRRSAIQCIYIEGSKLIAVINGINITLARSSPSFCGDLVKIIDDITPLLGIKKVR